MSGMPGFIKRLFRAMLKAFIFAGGGAAAERDGLAT